jgi:hypothetical protein
LPAEDWIKNAWQRTIVLHTPIVNRDIEHEIPLDGITAEKAGEIAIYRVLQYLTFRTAFDTNNTYGGAYFPLNIEPYPIESFLPDTEVDVRHTYLGMAEVNGSLCYKIGITFTPGSHFGDTYAVDVNNGNLVFEISVVDGSYRLYADVGQETISLGS